MQTLSRSMWDLVPWPGIKPGPPALGPQSLSHWTTREVSLIWLYSSSYLQYPPRCQTHSRLSIYFCLTLEGRKDGRKEIRKKRSHPPHPHQIPRVLGTQSWDESLWHINCPGERSEHNHSPMHDYSWMNCSPNSGKLQNWEQRSIVIANREPR